MEDKLEQIRNSNWQIGNHLFCPGDKRIRDHEGVEKRLSEPAKKFLVALIYFHLTNKGRFAHRERIQALTSLSSDSVYTGSSHLREAIGKENFSRYIEGEKDVGWRFQVVPVPVLHEESEPLAIPQPVLRMNPVHLLPPPMLGTLYGRQPNFASLHEKLLELQRGRSRSRHLFIRGIPGIGKTAFVSEVARNAKITTIFPDGVLWTALDQTPKMDRIAFHWAERMQPGITKGAYLNNEIRGRLLDLLEYRRMLLIVDDVWKPQDAEWFRKFAVGQNGILFATRFNTVIDAINIASDVEPEVLGPLEPPEALNILKEYVPSTVRSNKRRCEDLVGYLGGHPLGIKAAGHILRKEERNTFSVQELIDNILAGRESILSKDVPADMLTESGAAPTVDAVIRKTTQLIHDRDMLRRFAQIGAFSLEGGVIVRFADLAGLWKDDPRPAIRYLIDLGLLETVGEQVYSMHSIIAHHARELLKTL
jgi:hypothetical protein